MESRNLPFILVRDIFGHGDGEIPCWFYMVLVLGFGSLLISSCNSKISSACSHWVSMDRVSPVRRRVVLSGMMGVPARSISTMTVWGGSGISPMHFPARADSVPMGSCMKWRSFSSGVMPRARSCFWRRAS